MANPVFSNLRFLKSNCLNNVTPKIIATMLKVNISAFFFSIFLLFYYQVIDVAKRIAVSGMLSIAQVQYAIPYKLRVALSQNVSF